ncbi:MAG: FGGY-family carbohydrate kinase [Microthrixaceae bacterium]|nr:FGGY-family carbohydrate kinase [Microthrixaceae bacterium]
MTRRYLLTIDLGTSGPKAAVVSDDGRLVGTARGSVETVHRPDGAAEQDPEAVWRTTLDAAAAALAHAQVDRSSIAAVVASAQYSSIVPVAADGSPVGPMITWMDTRGSPKRLRKLDGYPRRAASPTGLLESVRVHGLAPVEAGMSLNHMRWLRYGEAEIYGRAEALLEPVDYLTARLTGRCTANRCSSFMQMLSDNRRGAIASGDTRWHPGLVARSLIDPAKLPEPVAVGSVVGTLTSEAATALGLPPTTLVLSGINDTQAGAIAAGAWRGDHAGLAIGTTSVITTHAIRKKVNPLRTLFTMPSPLGGNHLVAAENGVAGAAVDHFLDQYIYADDAFGAPASASERYQAFDDAVSSAAPGAAGLLFLPWLAGSLAPRADPRMRGGFIGMGLGTTRHDLARAIAEGIALNLRRVQGPVETFTGRPITQYSFYGGGSGSRAWAQVLADVLDRPVHRIADGGFANSFGTAMFGFEQLGIASAEDLADQLAIADTSEPDPTHRARYDHLSGTFQEAHRRTRPLMHSLNA